MKVLMFGWEFPPHIAGGLGTACYGITKGLCNNGVEVIFVMPKASGNEEKFIKIVSADEVEIDRRFSSFFTNNKNISFLEINSNIIPYVGVNDYYRLTNMVNINSGETTDVNKFKFPFAGGYNSDLMKEIEYLSFVAEQIAQSENFDIIHAHDWHTYKAGIAAKRISGKPLVVHIHATEFDRGDEKNRNTIVCEIEKNGMLAADLVLAVSDLTRRTVIDKYGISEDKVVTVHNAVEPAHKTILKTKNVKEKIVTFLGRVTFQKGPEYFVETAKKVLEKDDNVRFVLAGDGDMLPAVIKRVAQLGIADKFHFTGFLRGEDINTMFGMSDVYVMPSVSEPFGISPLEAMQADIPVIISKQSGVSEVLKYAVKVDFWDIDATADAIYALLHYPSLSNFLKEGGKQELVNLKWNHVGKKLYKIYENLLKR